MSAVAKNFDEIKLFAGSAGREPPPKPEQAWMDFEDMRQRNKDNTAVADKEPATILPQVSYKDKSGMDR